MLSGCLKCYKTNDDNMKTIQHIATCQLPTQFGTFTMLGFLDKHGKEHTALTLGDIENQESVLVRVHSECLTGDALFSQRCDCGAQLAASMQRIQQEGCGVIVYLRQEGRGIGLINKIKAYHLQDMGMDTVEANIALGLPVDNRDFTIARDILNHLQVQKIRLMTNNPEKIRILTQAGITITERIPLQVGIQACNRHYLQTKVQKLGHLIHLNQD